MASEQDFTQFIGKLVFAPEACGWGEFSAEKQELFCKCAVKAGLEVLFFLNIGEALPKKYHEEFYSVYHREALLRLIEKTQLMAFIRLLDERKITFLPIKGADLAFRIYPDAAMRTHVDWDILFRKEDCLTVIQVLLSQGWQTFSGHSLDEIGNWLHHYERLHNDRSALEVHYTLPNCEAASQEEIWTETVADAQGHRHLTPELSLLLLCSHASLDDFCHVSTWRLLLDAGYILRHDPVDWQKVQVLADKWGIIQPALLLSLWRDFFPEGILPQEGIDTEMQEALKIVFRMRGQIQQASRYDKMTVVGRGGIWSWMKDWLDFYCHPSAICLKYNLKRHQIFRMAVCVLCDFWGKVWHLCTHWRSRQSQEIRRYQKALSLLEKRGR